MNIERWMNKPNEQSKNQVGKQLVAHKYFVIWMSKVFVYAFTNLAYVEGKLMHKWFICPTRKMENNALPFNE